MKTLLQKVRWGRVWFALSLVIIGGLSAHAFEQHVQLERYRGMEVAFVPMNGNASPILFAPINDLHSSVPLTYGDPRLWIDDQLNLDGNVRVNGINPWTGLPWQPGEHLALQTRNP